MPLRVVGAGMGRTGTNSLKLALERLLGEPCYHMFECFQRPEHMPRWTAATRGELPDWDELLAGYGAAVDFPPAAFWPELMHSYPDALILLSVRDTDDWWRSASRTIFPSVLALPPGPLREMIDALWSARFTLDIEDEQAAKAAFEAFNDRVRAGVAPERLLEWRPGDGWEPICAALGLPVPPEPFPHVNTTADFLEEISQRRSE
ncbi:MAG: sulfotransferase family protein [Myxococcota bacterium]